MILFPVYVFFLFSGTYFKAFLKVSFTASSCILNKENIIFSICWDPRCHWWIKEKSIVCSFISIIKPHSPEKNLWKVSARPTFRLFFFLVHSSQISSHKTVHQRKPNLPLLLSYFFFLSHGFCHLWIKMCWAIKYLPATWLSR